jgi:hypothetical protein
MKNTCGGPFAEIDLILGEPSLLKSDDPDQYRALEKKFEQILKPQNFVDALEARDIVNATWERRTNHGVRAVTVGVESDP